MYTLVKLFSLSMAPAELRDATEGQILRTADPETDAPLLMVWVGKRMSTFEPPKQAAEPSKVTAWEHLLHIWLIKSGAEPGDVVLLTWETLPSHAAARHPSNAKPRRSAQPDANHGVPTEHTPLH